MRKQLEIVKLNQQLGEWTTRYMELQNSQLARNKKTNSMTIPDVGDLKSPKDTNEPSSYLKILLKNSPLNSMMRASPGVPIKREGLKGDKTPPQFF